MTRSQPLRILHVRTVNGTGGGPDKTIFRSCQYLQNAGHHVHAFYILDRKNDTGILTQKAQEFQVPVTTALETGPVSLDTVRSFCRRVSDGKYDVVHTHEYKSNLLAWYFRRKFGYKIVATAHGYNRTTLREYFYYRLERWILRRADAVITPTGQMRKQLIGFGLSPDRVHTIPNGIDIAGRPQPSRKLQGSRISLLYLGRLSEEKDPANLLFAVAELKKRKWNVELVLAGAGPEQQSLENQTRSHGLNDQVTMLGYVMDISPLLARADVLINPSRTECMPNSILEAMSSGVPVVATDVGGVSEMIRDGVDGLLCPARDPISLANAIECLLTHPDRAQQMAENARLRVINEFSFEKHMRDTLKLYNSLL